MDKLKSRKFIVTVLAAILVLLNDKFNLGISQEAIYSAVGMLGLYVVGQGVADAGSQGRKKVVWNQVETVLDGVKKEIESHENAKTD